MSERHGASETWRGYALATLAAACWATSGVVAKWIMTPAGEMTSGWVVQPPGITMSPTALAGARAATAFVLLAVYLLIRRPRAFKVTRRDIPVLAVFGVVGMAGLHAAYYQAISYSNVATAVLLEYLAPVIVLVVSVLFLSEKLTWVLPVGVFLSVGGCALVVGAFGEGGLEVSPAGVAWGLAAAVVFAFYQLMGKWASTRFSPWTLLAYGLGFATVFWLVYLGGWAPILDAYRSTAGVVAVVYLGLVGTIVPFAASLKALHYIDATKAVVTSTLEPVLAGIIAWTTLQERFDALQIVGGVVVLAAILLVQLSSRLEEQIPPVA